MAQSPGSQDENTGARRGRRPVRPDPGSGPVALFAHRLWELKEQAGDPSFADMASRLGAAASKSSLAAAARGTTMPSWETTWEFVRVLAVHRLGRNEDEVRREWRTYWEEASRPANGPRHTITDEAPTSDEPPASDDPPPGPRPTGKRPRSGRRHAVLAAICGVVGAGAILIGWVLPHIVDDAEGTPTPPATPFDDSVFEKDVTYPDGTVVQSGTSFDKTWRIRNSGNIPWQDRYLTRMNDTPCKAPKRVAIGPVLPGESVDITVRVRAADSPGRCKIFWKMTDEHGAPLLAAKKPIFLDVSVT
ncbi:transcriptional regulator [Nonomuraea sp. PA05]|uniref:NBR1-Ig-like domain-containing protein n=1 Tax=Nonomuraea sp. PA05 TaxID=2604466 RepID=UPI0011D64AF8|nr:NBR1-Ig-like domain-containing protein [Nonomuraea sp. PA05]TYB61884.1 transcriptional regulator [Nonomuraea sp. PA05]